MTAEAALAFLTHAFRNGRFSHAYLLVGSPRGAAGDLATAVVQLVACTSDAPPCRRCDACKQAAARTWPDALWVEPAKKSRIISADQMREQILPRVQQTSFGGGWKAAVITGADRLNESAANIFLKTLEEPPPQTVIVLLSDSPQALLPTIVSRCQRLDVDDPAAGRLPEPWLSRVLDVLGGPRIAGPVEALAAGTQLCAILDDMKRAAAREIDAEVRRAGDQVEVDEDELDARVSARYREGRALLLQAWQAWYRDLLALKVGAPQETLRYPDRLAVLKPRAERLTLSQALANVDGIEELATQLERNLREASLFGYWFDRFADGAAAS